MKRKSIFILILTLVLIFSVGTSFSYGASLSDINNKLSNEKNQLEEGKKQEESLANEINKIESQISEKQEDINKLNKDIDKTHKEINEVSEKLKKQKEKVDKNVDALNKRLRSIYKGGSISFIDVIFSSDNVSDLLSNVEMVKYIYSSDKDIVATLKKEYKEIEKKKTKLNNLKASLRNQQHSIEEKQSALNADKTTVAQKKAAVADNNSNIEDNIAELEKQQARIQAIISSSSGNSGGGQEYSGTSSGLFIWPTPGYYSVTSEFGMRVHPITHVSKMHTGIDISAPGGAPIVAAGNGSVIFAGWLGGYGNAMILSHGGGMYTLYAHCSSLIASQGSTVKQGQTIARVGSTGMSTGAHLHFEVRVGGNSNGNPVNPRGYLK